MTDRRITHSDLTRSIQAILVSSIEDVPKMIQELISYTANGVFPEGADMREASEVVARNYVGPAVTKGNGFFFGKSSEKELIGVKPELVQCVRLALTLSTQDFMVFDGIRSEAEQRQHVKNGTSKTMKSKHLEGLAVDLVPFIDGKPKWDWDGCYRIAYAMGNAAEQLGCAHRITWGGAWDRRLLDFNNFTDEGVEANFKRAVEEYRVRHPGPDFIDGPHFEWRS